MREWFEELPDKSGLDATKLTKAQAAGPAVIPMWVADMDYAIAPPITKALVERAQTGVAGYTDRAPRYYKVVSQWLETRHGLKVPPGEILLSTGVIHAMHAALRAVTQKGDSVLTFTPIYHPFYDVIEANGRTCIRAKMGAGNPIETLKKEALQHNVKCILLCNPYNPLGFCWGLEQLQEMVDFCRENHIKIISDEIHADIVYSGAKHTSLLMARGADEVGIVCMSPCKTFNIAGLKVSYLVIRNKAMRNAVEAEMHRSNIHSVNTMGLVALEAAYTQGAAWLDEALVYLEENRNLLAEFIKTRLPKARFAPPQATYLAWVNLSAYTAENAQDFLLKKAGVMVNGGQEFAPKCSTHVRLNFATSRAILQRALHRIENAVLKGGNWDGGITGSL